MMSELETPPRTDKKVCSPASGGNGCPTVSLGAGPSDERCSFILPTLPLDGGGQLAPVTVAYESWGRLAPTRDNVILLCHALTGDAHACDLAQPDDPRAGWWNPLIGPGRVFDTERFYILCANVLGSCYGSTGPTSAHPTDGQPYRLRFPHITIGDIVRAQQALLAGLGIRRLACVAGGSIGGLQALEWAIAYPDLVDRAIVIAATPRLSALGVGIDAIARQAVMGDPAWQEGNYLPGAGPAVGLGIGRMLNMLTYTSREELDERFGRRHATRASQWPTFGPPLDLETYLQHQADKLNARFDANSYLYLTEAMDRYDAAQGPGRDSDAAALGRIRARVLAIGIDTDWLYPAAEVRSLARGINQAGGRADFAEIGSIHGHDAFLKDWEPLTAVLWPFVAGAGGID